ncbi:uncharacterized protein LOC124456899 [Xenia sp. Carnegie-2017]|uniref:uncharacterized protein LOC124456899 n=1 Tax=Xenia sp. Carnegie-2017 TaxID=2897299 RepID=UPI001F04B366|nr:uncharacterized protein LOC124456899 [Xenia sp. Carnegie-2017]
MEELDVTEREIFAHVQNTTFSQELKLFAVPGNSNELDKALLRKSGISIRQLNPMMVNGLLKVGGRLGNAPSNGKSKHPIILPFKHPVTDMIIRQHHAEVGHMGQESVLSSLTKEFWIIKGRTAVRRVVRSCLACQRRKARLGEQLMSDLPESRVTPQKPPFTIVGIDYFGPMLVKRGRSLVKRYGCLFTCFTTRAIHIEIAHSLGTDSMINALRRFISMRGCPEQIRSDRGTNFVSANKELNKGIEEWDQSKVDKFCTQRRSKWHFNPPSASHMGGVWERMIRSVRQILKAIPKEQVVSDEVLQTVIAEVVLILNSRPLTRNSDSPEDDDPLTPNHLLHLRASSSLPPGLFDKNDLCCKKNWKQAQYLANVFWRRWLKEYLPTLMERKKWYTPRRNLKKGDLVLVADENYPRGQWPIGLVIEAIASNNGYVRTVKVEQLLQGDYAITRAAQVRNLRGDSSHSHLLRRSIRQLIPIEVDQEEDSNESVESDKNGEEEQVLRPTDRPQRSTGITGQLRRLQNTNKF